MFAKSKVLLFCIPLFFLLVYFQVFFADYAYLDEIHQLWHNNDNTNFIMFHTQGRWLSGLLFQKLFSSISSIEQLKFLRVFCLAGWILTTLLWAAVWKKWVEWLDLAKGIWWLGCLYVPCSISVCIYVGWASCIEVFLAIGAGLLSGHILFRNLYPQQKEVHLSNQVVFASLALGVVSLFIYQNAFGIFLIPFFIYYVQRGMSKLDRTMVIGIVFYLATYIIYYFLFKYSLKAYQLEASMRTELHFSFLKKLSFFFSGPFPQGFSMNLLFSSSSIFSQVFYPLIFITWTIITFRRNTHNSFAKNILFVGVVLILLALIYLPSLVAAENFASYRTLFAFNLAVFIMVTDCVLHLFKSEKKRRLFVVAISLWILATGIYTFNFQFIRPLKHEYRVLRDYVKLNYHSGISQVYFIRAGKFSFVPEFHTQIYRDEFGTPSTYRDWVPIPITKQIVFEITKDRKVAEDLNVVQFENETEFIQSGLVPNTAALVIDMPLLLGKH